MKNKTFAQSYRLNGYHLENYAILCGYIRKGDSYGRIIRNTTRITPRCGF